MRLFIDIKEYSICIKNELFRINHLDKDNQNNTVSFNILWLKLQSYLMYCSKLNTNT